jgi:hypothetical protein
VAKQDINPLVRLTKVLPGCPAPSAFNDHLDRNYFRLVELSRKKGVLAMDRAFVIPAASTCKQPVINLRADRKGLGSKVQNLKNAAKRRSKGE